jgi:hypothetical protein
MDKTPSDQPQNDNQQADWDTCAPEQKWAR